MSNCYYQVRKWDNHSWLLKKKIHARMTQWWYVMLLSNFSEANRGLKDFSTDTYSPYRKKWRRVNYTKLQYQTNPQNIHSMLVQVCSHFIPVSFWCETPKAASKSWKTADWATLAPEYWKQNKILRLNWVCQLPTEIPQTLRIPNSTRLLLPL